MSIANSLNDMITYLQEAYQSLEYKQVILPENKNFKNLADAIAAISTGAQCYDSIDALMEVEAANGTLALVYAMDKTDAEGNEIPDAFYGIFKRVNGTWEIAPSQIDAYNYHLVDGIGYGAEGVITKGTFTNNYCYSKQEVLDKINAWNEISLKEIDARSLNSVAWAFQGVNFDTDKCTSLNLLLPQHPTNMQGTFANASLVNIDLIPRFDTNLATDMSYLFYRVNGGGLLNYLNEIHFTTTNTTNMAYLFAGSQNGQLIYNITEQWSYDTSNVSNMSHMFADINNFSFAPIMNTDRVTDMSYMFHSYNVSELQSIPEYNTKNVTNMAYMFYNCRNLIALPNLNVYYVTNIHNMFWAANNLKFIPNTWLFSRVQDAAGSFMHCSNLQSVSNFSSSLVNAKDMFYNCHNLTTVGNISMSYTSDITRMFHNCENLINIGTLTGLGAGFYYNTLDDTTAECQTLNLQTAQNLSYNSIANIVNSITNITSYNKQGRLLFNSVAYNLITDEDKNIINNKGWHCLVSTDGVISQLNFQSGALEEI